MDERWKANGDKSYEVELRSMKAHFAEHGELGVARYGAVPDPVQGEVVEPGLERNPIGCSA